MLQTDWNGKPYHSLDYELKKIFGKKVYKLALDGGMTCPNRDGTLGRGGCIFCSAGGSGDFAEKKAGSLREQADLAKARVRRKISGDDASYVAYFQSYTNTYAPLSYLEQLFSEALSLPEICALSIGTRPDCRIKSRKYRLELTPKASINMEITTSAYKLPYAPMLALRTEKPPVPAVANDVVTLSKNGIPPAHKKMISSMVRKK